MTPATRNQVFRPGELPLVLLALLDASPMNGYEVLGELGRLFAPDYKPSPGGVYPALQALLEEKLISTDKADRKRYRLTAAGTAALRKRAAPLAAIEVRTGVHLREGDGVAEVLDRFGARVLAVAGRVDRSRIERVLDDAATRIERFDAEREDER